MIYYFSATGNTRWASQTLSGLIKEPLYDIKQGLPSREDFLRDDVIGFCVPVHGWQLSKLVLNFIKGLPEVPASKQPYVFVLLTCGDDCGLTMQYYNRVAQSKSLQYDAAFSLIMPESYVGLPFMNVDTKENEIRKIKTASERLVQIAKAIVAREKVYDVHEGSTAWIKSKILGWFFHKFLVTDKLFKVNKAGCIGCGKCQKVCPVNDIVLDPERHPTWKHNDRCLTCLACYHNCPSHAIIFNNETKKKGQYVFPTKTFPVIEEGKGNDTGKE